MGHSLDPGGELEAWPRAARVAAVDAREWTSRAAPLPEDAGDHITMVFAPRRWNDEEQPDGEALGDPEGEVLLADRASGHPTREVGEGSLSQLASDTGQKDPMAPAMQGMAEPISPVEGSGGGDP